MLRLKTEWAKILYFAAMQKGILEKAVFLDRDGVLNHEPDNYTWQVEKFTVLPGVMDSLKAWKHQGYGLIVITNQGGIAKGLYSEDDVHAVHQYFQGLSLLEGFSIDAFYFCPHHPEFSGKCLCRKPGSLMIEKAIHHFGLDPFQCVMIGDKERDMIAASGAGVKGILVETNHGLHPDLLSNEA